MNTIVGALLGDFVGSVYERSGCKGMTLPLTSSGSRITDDSVMTFATLQALKTRQPFARVLANLVGQYAHAGFGSTMQQWLAGEDASYINSNSNGAAIRISPLACLNIERSKMLRLVEINAAITHTGEYAVAGACALADAIYLARHGMGKPAIKHSIEQRYGLCLNYDANELFAHFTFTTAAVITVPIAIWLGVTARDPMHCLRLGLHIGGDTDSILSMAMALALSFEQAVVPKKPYNQLVKHLAIHYPEIKQSLALSQLH